MNIVFMSMDTLPSTLWARDLYDQMHIRSDFRKWFPRMCQYGFIEGRDYEYMPRVRLQDEGGRTVQRYVKDYRITQDILYAAAYRAARAMGYNRVVTYILDTENGSSLKAAGYTCEGRAGGLEWNGAKAPKQADQYPRQMKTRWVKKKEGLHGS